MNNWFNVTIPAYPDYPEGSGFNIFDDGGRSLMFVVIEGTNGRRYPVSITEEAAREVITVLAYWLSTREGSND